MANLPAGFEPDKEQPALPAGFVPDEGTSGTSVQKVPAASSLDEPESPVGRNLRQFLGVDPRARFSFANVLHPDLGVAADAAKNVVANAPAGAAAMVKAPFQAVASAAQVNPMDAVRNPGAALREAGRQINDVVPGASTLAEMASGPKAVYDEADAKAVPHFRDILPAALSLEGGLRAGGATVDALARRAAEAPAREAASTFRDLGKSAVGNGKARLEQIGPEAVARVDSEFGITKAPDPRAAVQAAKAQVGAARTAAYDVVQKAGGDVDLGTVAKGLDRLEAQFRNKAATRKFADDVAELRDRLVDQHGANQPDTVRVSGGSSGSGATPAGVPGVRVVGGSTGRGWDANTPPRFETIPGAAGSDGAAPTAPTFERVRQPRTAAGGRISAAKLQEEISAVNDGAYGSNYANPKAAQVVQRRTAGALREVLDSHLDDVAKKGPEARDAVDAIEDANAKFAVLKTIEPIVKKQAVVKAFAPPPDSLITKAQELAHVVRHPATLIPKAAEVAAGGLDALGRKAAALRRAVPVGPDGVLAPLIARALRGDAAAAARVAQLSRNPIVAARVNALRRQAEAQP